MFGKNLFAILSMVLIITSCSQIDNQVSSNGPLMSDVEMEKELYQVVLKIWEDANNSNIAELKSAHLDSPKFSKFGPRVAERQNVEQTNITETEHF